MPTEFSDNLNEWFQSCDFAITLLPETTTRKFNSLDQLRAFIQQEIKFWQPIDAQITSRFHGADRNLEEAITAEAQNAQQRIKTAIDALKTKPTQYENGYIIFSQTKVAKELKQISEKYGKESEGYKAFLQAALSDHVRTAHIGKWSTQEFFGVFDAYVYRRLNENVKTSTANAKKSLVDLESRQSVICQELVDQKHDNQTAFKVFQNDCAKWLSDKNEQVDTNAKSQLESQNKTFQESEQNWRNRIEELENLYRDKLSLEAPVAYWEKLRKKHNCWGFVFSTCTALLSVVMVWILTTALYKWPPGWISANKWDLNTLKGSFLLLTITSIAAYAIHFLAKFAISAFHLARDAEERRQLTYVYLALLEKEAVPNDDQKIVLQALFSRADTGLLKGDHGPTMPATQVMSMFK